MPNKKGSRVAASRARAQAKAKKKQHSSGPVIAAAAYEAQAAAAEDLELQPEADDDAISASEAVAVVDEEPREEAPVAAVARAPMRAQRGPARRERQTLAAVQGGSLRHEISWIGAVTIVAGIALVGLKLATDIGR